MSKYGFFGAALLLLSQAIAPIKNVFTGQSSSPASASSNAGATVDNTDLTTEIDWMQTTWPKSRTLTEDEVQALAEYVREHYGLTTMYAKQLKAIAYIESSFRPWVQRDESRGRKSTGLMQTLLETAMDMYRKGYKDVGRPTEQALKDPLVSMYFGAAYFDWLKQNWPGRDLEWYIRAYNGGPGWERTQNGPSMTQAYYDKWFKAMKFFSITIRTVS